MRLQSTRPRIKKVLPPAPNVPVEQRWPREQLRLSTMAAHQTIEVQSDGDQLASVSDPSAALESPGEIGFGSREQDYYLELFSRRKIMRRTARACTWWDRSADCQCSGGFGSQSLSCPPVCVRARTPVFSMTNWNKSKHWLHG